MSIPTGARARRSPVVPRAPMLVLALLLPMTATLALRAGSLADPGSRTLRFTPDQADAAGLRVDLRPHPALPAPVLELHGAMLDRAGGRAGVLAASPDGSRVALADAVGEDPTTLVIADAEGGQLRVPFDGLLSAAFSADASWLAASDGFGRLWQVDTVDGGATLLADGPFMAALDVEPSGSVLALAVPSVEAPFSSRLVRVDQDGRATLLSDEELVYDATPLADGALAVVAHRPAGTLLLRLRDDIATIAADLGPGAVNVGVSSDLALVAWERDGYVFARGLDGRAVRIGPGARPRVAANGRMLLVDASEGTTAYAPDGSIVAELPSAAVLAGCGGCAS